MRYVELLEGKERPEGDMDDDHQSSLETTGYWGRAGAGCLFFARESKRFMLAHRSEDVEQPGTWGTWGGAIDRREDPTLAARREAREETGYAGRGDLEPLYVFINGGFRYSNYLLIVEREFTPRLNWENRGFRWCDMGAFPEPMHFGLVALLGDASSVAKMRRLAN